MTQETSKEFSVNTDALDRSPHLTGSSVLTFRSALSTGLLVSWFLWLAGPLIGWFPMAMVAITPLLMLIKSNRQIGRRGWCGLLLGIAVYFLVSLQGLRNAHPAMFLCWIGLSTYLAIYPVLFVAIGRQMRERFPLALIAPVTWIALEWIRNYLLTGISVLMLGHTQANASLMIQIAELFGTYGVSFVLVTTNVAALAMIQSTLVGKLELVRIGEIAAGAAMLSATLLFGHLRTNQLPGSERLATFMLLQRSEPVMYGQSYDRELEIFRNYARDAVNAVQRSEQTIDAIVWPESMFTGGSHWLETNKSFVVPPEASLTKTEFLTAVEKQREYILNRSRTMTGLMNQPKAPHFLAGCGVIRYGEQAQIYSGLLHITPDSEVDQWYGKRHLVMFGEYIPLIPRIPILKRLVPPGLGITQGSSTTIMDVEGTRVSPNICIETAVERVTLAQMQQNRQMESPDVIVAVTNDGWFGNSSVIDHHLRCLQLVAVGCRRPILSAANNGPTVWVDEKGQIIERLNTGDEGQIIATPHKTSRRSLYARIGDWPVCLVTLACGVMLWISISRKKLLDAAE